MAKFGILMNLRPVLLGLVTAIGGCISNTDPADSQAVNSSLATHASDNEDWHQIVQLVQTNSATEVHLSKTPIQDSQLRDIAGNRLVKTLILDAGQITDRAMATIGSLESLVHLRVRESRITNTGIQELIAGKAKAVRILNLPHATITAEGLRLLAELPNLQQLRLGGPHIGDQEMAEIAKLPKLESLHLIGPRLTDQALEYVATMPELGSFYLDDCALSDAAWKKLFETKPNLHVHIDQHHHDRDPAKHLH